MPAKKKAGGRGRGKSAKAKKEALLLDSGQFSMGTLLVIVEKGTKKDNYDVRPMRAMHDVEWYAPDGTDLWIEFVGSAKPKGLKTVKLSGKRVKFPRNEHAKVPTQPNQKGVVVEYYIHVTFDGEEETIDPFIIIQP